MIEKIKINFGAEQKEVSPENKPLNILRIIATEKPDMTVAATSQIMGLFAGDPFRGADIGPIDLDDPEGFVSGIERVAARSEGFQKKDTPLGVDTALGFLEGLVLEGPEELPEVLAILGGMDPTKSDIERVRLFINRLRNTFQENKDMPYLPFVLYIGGHQFFGGKHDVDLPEADFVLPMSMQFFVGLAMQFQTIPDMMDSIETRYGEQVAIYKSRFYNEYKNKLKGRSEFTADLEQELKILEDVFQKNNVESVLDAGGGEGRIAGPLEQQGYEVVGIDISPELVEKATDNGYNFILADLKNMPLASDSRDAVTFNWHVFCDILGVHGKRRVLGEAARILKENGVVVLDIPDRSKLEIEKDGIYFDNPGGEHVYIGYVPLVEDIKKLLEEAGFKDIEIKEWQTSSGYPKLTFVGKK